ncbi:MarR family transcriptional regulator [Glutamicibacter sp. MNS18]|uniref:MarR family winged helix-turn-helix transcriptional regulator n=1 Tax=Glutamicibacter sp. MNS18 TaxID=2989817 RepID=UPI002235F21C|nr:MarR family transcriptional regulator [Glutamicibacter sp. MNS18]MCW4463926.1 MarR family transcriptional regulator [Glutamicibacter sp. MNS18]
MDEQQAWLNDEEREAWLGLQSLFTLLPGVLDTDLQGLQGITLFDYHMLAMLSEAPERNLSMTDLAARTSASLSRLSHVVKKLEARGWVVRLQSKEDARVKIASLTTKGWDVLVQIAPHHVATVRSLVFDSLDDKDVKDLSRISRKIVRALDEEHWILDPA